jgi:hypothetical protein
MRVQAPWINNLANGLSPVELTAMARVLRALRGALEANA